MRITDKPILQELLGPELKARVIIFLMANQAPLTERELARLLGKSHTAVNRTLMELRDLGAVECRSIGRAHTWMMNEKSLAYKVLSEASPWFRVTPLRFVKETLHKALKNLEDREIVSAYIFGSIAEGTSRVESDIDVLIMTDKKGKDKDRIMRLLEPRAGMPILEKTGNRVTFHIFDMDSLERNRPPWLREAIERGIKVY